MRTIAQVGAGVLGGAPLVGVPVWATADSDQGQTPQDMASMMSDQESQRQMMRSMSEMMSGPQLRRLMVSMMSEAMAKMPGMNNGMPGGMSDMENMPDMEQRRTPDGSAQN